MSWWKKSKRFIALDMGQRSVKGISLKKEKKRVRLEHAFIHDYSLTNPEFPNNTDIIKNLKMISEVQNVKEHDAILNIGTGHLATFDLQLPLMPQKELEEVIRAEVEKHLSYPIEKALYDYLILEQSGEENPLLKIKVFTTKKNKVDVLLKMVSQATLKPTIVDSDLEAIVRALLFNDYLKDDHLHVIVDLAETHTTVALTHGHKLIASSQLEISMGLINHRLHHSFSLTYAEAEKVKSKISLKAGEVENDPQVKLASESYVEILAKIQESIDYLSEFHFKKWPVAAFYFMGGGASITGVTDVFQDHYKFPCLIPNPFKNIDLIESAPYDKSLVLEKQFLMPLSVGLALRGVA